MTENKSSTGTQKKRMNFVVKESNFSARVKSRWRFPRGKHSKVRQMHKGRPALPNPGHGSPVATKGLHVSGLKPVVISNKNELSNIDVSLEGAIISGKIGNKKRLELLRFADENKISLLNVKGIAELTKKIKDNLVERKRSKQDKLKKQSEKEAEKKKKAQKKKEKEDKEKITDSVEDKIEKSEKEKKQQKEIAQKVITKKQ